MVRVMVVDDHEIVREGLRRVLDRTDGVEWAGGANDVDGAIEALRTTPCDAMVIDLDMPGGGGGQLIRRVRRDSPTLPIVVYTMHAEDHYAIQLLRSGVNAFVSKERRVDELITAIRTVAGGGHYVTPELGALMLTLGQAVERGPALTRRECEVLRLVASGERPSDVATSLGLALSTVSTHLNHVREKLGARTVPEAIREAIRAGIID